jgi:hypothetical protein
VVRIVPPGFPKGSNGTMYEEQIPDEDGVGGIVECCEERKKGKWLIVRD